MVSSPTYRPGLHRDALYDPVPAATATTAGGAAEHATPARGSAEHATEEEKEQALMLQISSPGIAVHVVRARSPSPAIAPAEPSPRATAPPPPPPSCIVTHRDTVRNKEIWLQAMAHCIACIALDAE